jgi:allantoinase
MSSALIANGHVVDERAVRRADLLLRDGQIEAILDPGRSPHAEHVVDASGLHVLPGLVDTHVHFNEPGRTEWEGFVSGSTAAAAGGVTTVCDMPLNCHPPTLDGRALALKHAALEGKSRVDFALWGGIVPGSASHLSELRAGGVVGVKAFLCDSGLETFPHLNEFDLLDAVQACADAGVLLALHAEDPDHTRRLSQAAKANRQNAPLDWARSRPPATEVEAVRRALDLGRATGARLHFVHISTAAAVRLIATARANGQDVSVETCPHYLLLDETDFERLGSLGKCAPPLRSRAEVEALWPTVLDGAVDWIASDHSPCPPSLKTPDDIWSAWGGLGGVQSSLVALLTEGVHRRNLSLPRVASLTAANPARRLGLWPRKGSLEVGGDADLTLVDLNDSWTLRKADLQTRWPVSPYLGRTFHGRVRMTLVRGTVVWQDGGPRVAPGFGRLVRV